MYWNFLNGIGDNSSIEKNAMTMEEILESLEIWMFCCSKGRRGRFHDHGWQGRMGMTGLMLGLELGQQLLSRWVFLEQHWLQQLWKNTNLKMNHHCCRWTTLWWTSWNRPQGMTKQRWLFNPLPRRQNQILAVWFSKKAAESVTLSPRVLFDHQIVQEWKSSKTAWPHSEVARIEKKVQWQCKNRNFLKDLQYIHLYLLPSTAFKETWHAKTFKTNWNTGTTYLNRLM